jgi:N-acetylmuramic acid 6-phosphate etherase
MDAPSEPRGHLVTEQRLAASRGLDAMTTAEAFDVMNAQDATVAGAVAEARDAIVRAVDLIVERLARGGRLFYVGAGTSGRLGVLDAAELPPTFHSRPQRVQAILAGGSRAVFEAVEGAEDAEMAARARLQERRLTADDVVFGITAGGTTPYVRAALRCAAELGAATVLLACVPFEQVPDDADVSIRVVTGPEVVTGSTRLKAGTATKLVLNAVSTLVMVRRGKVHDNLMVDVQTRGNAKLRDRGVRMLRELCDLDADGAADLLDRAEGHVKRAVLMHQRGLDSRAALELLRRHGQSLRAALAADG